MGAGCHVGRYKDIDPSYTSIGFCICKIHFAINKGGRGSRAGQRLEDNFYELQSRILNLETNIRESGPNKSTIDIDSIDFNLQRFLIHTLLNHCELHVFSLNIYI